MRRDLLLVLTLILGIEFSIFGQKTKVLADTNSNNYSVKVDSLKNHSPTKATLMSAAIPGLGQIYNKKYWKLPIVYGAIGVSMYFGISNNNEFKRYRTAYTLRLDENDNTVDEFEGLLSEEGIRSNMDFHQRNRDLSFIFVGLFYVLNIVDAAVDAHLFNFPKNDKLSFFLQPSIDVAGNNELAHGVKLTIGL